MKMIYMMIDYEHYESDNDSWLASSNCNLPLLNDFPWDSHDF